MADFCRSAQNNNGQKTTQRRHQCYQLDIAPPNFPRYPRSRCLVNRARPPRRLPLRAVIMDGRIVMRRRDVVIVWIGVTMRVKETTGRIVVTDVLTNVPSAPCRGAIRTANDASDKTVLHSLAYTETGGPASRPPRGPL